jgi:hypothetical protein
MINRSHYQYHIKKGVARLKPPQFISIHSKHNKLYNTHLLKNQQVNVLFCWFVFGIPTKRRWWLSHPPSTGKLREHITTK